MALGKNFRISDTMMLCCLGSLMNAWWIVLSGQQHDAPRKQRKNGSCSTTKFVRNVRKRRVAGSFRPMSRGRKTIACLMALRR